jgi:hypothetical protein
MGTRNLTMVIQKEKPVISQYGQWDGYPSGNGLTILEFLRTCNLDEFKEKIKNVRFSTKKDEKKVEKFLKSIGCKDGWMNMDQSDLYKKAYPYSSRDIGAGILQMVNESEDTEIVLQDTTKFAADSLFCEWAYLINLDNNNLEVYEGFNNSPLEEGQRFKDMELEDNLGGEQYYPIKCVKIYPLDKLPTNEEFINELEKKEE